jgi:2-keto-3-deoxy-L-fuconate dehydrogenase
MPGPLADKTAFVTAAGQGIGRATALAFAAAGARVIATDIDAAKVQAIASDNIRTARLDVLSADAIAQAARDAGAIDILFNCAGVVHQGTLLEAKEGDWTLAFDLNVRSMFRTMQAFVPGMVARGHGVILNMASVSSSLKGVPNRFIYSATKAAVIGMTRSPRHTLQLSVPRHRADAQPRGTDRGECGAGRIATGGASGVRRSPADGPARHARGDR